MVTGANGFVGKALTLELLKRKSPVTALIFPGTTSKDIGDAQIEALPIRNSPRFRELLNQQDVIVNLAGNLLGANPRRYIQANIETVNELAKALQELESPPRLIHISSNAAIGPSSNEKSLTEKATRHPVGLYGTSKKNGENVLLKSNWKFPYVILRPPSIYGPEDKCFLDLFKWAEKGIFLKLGTRYKHFQLLFRQDFIQILLKIIEKDSSEKILHVGDPKIFTDTDLSNELGAAAGKKLVPFYFPPSFVKLAGRVSALIDAGFDIPLLLSPSKSREMNCRFWVQDFGLFEEVYGKFNFTTLNDGVTKTREWYKQKRWIK
ncbi:MAG: NAD(P)-dependent oxidoreductase [Candidatus Riflebacteria bacterium]|nr:NAD(P)-dependent oxidoreductase [Candidatus Riflebacteria bacterium]